MSFGLVLALVALVALALVVGLAVAVVVFATSLRSRGLERARRANQLIPGQDGVAPAAWAGSHHPEARLHRRMVAALAGVRSAEAAGGLGITDLRIQLELQASQLDRRLVAVAAVIGESREAALRQVTADIDELERVAGQTMAVAAGTDPDPAAVEALGRRLRALGPGGT